MSKKAETTTALPPWKTHPHLYRDREHFASVVLEAVETSCYYEDMPLASVDELAEHKAQLLDELRRLYPED